MRSLTSMPWYGVEAYIAALGRCERGIGRRADVLIELMRNQGLDVAARADVKAPARFQRIGSVVLARVTDIEAGAAAGAELERVYRPVGDGAQAGADVERHVCLSPVASQDVVGG